MSAWQEEDGRTDSVVQTEVGQEPSGDSSETHQCSISWRRVGALVSVALLVIVPTIFHFAQSGMFDEGCSGGTCVNLGAPNSWGPDFDLSSVAIPVEEILHGGPPKDGIPALSRPNTIPATDADYLNDQSRVIGLVFDGESRAYPLSILNHHEIVNDEIGERAVAVTYCPLCDSAAVFDRQTELGPREFGVSGLLYNSNVLMYDRTEGVESLWSQIKSEGVSGPGNGVGLTALPFQLTTWGDWKARHPETIVLSSQTGHVRDYAHNPYAGYFESAALLFPVDQLDNRLAAKQRVLGVWSGDTYRAYPELAFDDKQNRLEGLIDGKRLVIEFDAESQSMRVSETEEGVEWMYSLWFAWYAMHPETELYQPAQ